MYESERPATASPMMKTLEIPETLAPLKERIEAALTPAVALLADPTASGRTHFGGQPLGSRGTRWPRSPSRPMSFIGQIDLAEVSNDKMPSSGLLQLFYDVEEQKWGFDVADSDWWQVIYIANTDDLVPVPVPAERFPSFERTALVAKPYLSAPSIHDECLSGALRGSSDSLLEAYGDFLSEWHATVFGHDGQAHQVIGHADWVQSDARVEAEKVRRARHGREGRPAEWQLIWQIASDDALGFMWGDLGYLYLMAPAEESQRGDFSRCHLTLQCN